MHELTRAEVDELLREQVVGRVGCHAEGVTYVVPVIYAYDDDCIHVALIEGQKVRMMRANPAACFEVDEYRAPGNWRSAIVHGAYEESNEAEAARSLARPARGAVRGRERDSAGGSQPRSLGPGDGLLPHPRP